ncbi:hypothetical protein [Arenibaculum sp.]|jgi:hypothetical protein|uniref:hypothetical protein n=1 Tax=Arenibaculum sp. TaxID=2865862 RepID=UPI002E0D8534|nr:hypothetical protein [Arenibaculum sp.]
MQPSRREAELEAALAEVLREATAARAALCEQELLVRLENIARRAEAALRECGGTRGG